MRANTETAIITTTLLAGTVLLGLVVSSGEVMGQARMPCHNAAESAKQLATRYEEAPVAFGLQSNGNLLQVYHSAKKDTWTVVSTTPNGMSCIVAAGKGWQSLPIINNDPMA